jgi:alkylation response protein AidB-like acyl-CoA dehydrogenase
MNFDLTQDQRDIKRTAREFLAARYPLEKVRRIAFDGEPDPHWDEIAELGWPGIAEFGMLELAVVAEELGYSLAPSPLASTWAASLLHPGLEGRGTVAMWDEDGPPRFSDGRLHAAKIAVPNADVADVIVVSDRNRFYAVRDAAVDPVEALDRTRPLFTVRCEGAEAVELEPRSWSPLFVAAAAEAVGVAARVMEMTVAYAKERKQFGRPIATYQAISHACAQMFLETEGARSITYWAAWALDNDADAAPTAAYSAKAYASDAAVNVTRRALQVHGGIGFTWEHDLHLFLKRAESLAHSYGDARWHREQLAGLLL